MNFEVSPLVREAGDEWQEATTAYFLDAIRDGALPDEALDRWLVQDRIFVDELFRFQAVVLAKAPEDARGPILDGLTARGSPTGWSGPPTRSRSPGSPRSSTRSRSATSPPGPRSPPATSRTGSTAS